MGTPSNINLSLYDINGRSQGIYIPIPDTSNTNYLFPSEYVQSASPFGMRAYWPDLSNPTLVQNWNNAYTGLEWTQPFYAYGATGPVLYEIVQAPSGMTIGSEMIRDGVTSYFKFDELYGVLKWENPVAGNYQIAIRATDQLGQKVFWIFYLLVGTANHHFMALNATGDGSGSSPSNYASYSSTIIAPTTVSPSKGKVLHIKGDNYPATSGLYPSTAYTAASFIAMPGETFILNQRVTISSSNITLHGVEINGVGVASEGVIVDNIGSEYFGLWKFVFRNCVNTDVGTSSNQSCVAMMSAGKASGRRGIFIQQGDFINCNDLHGFDYYRVADNVFNRCNLIINNGTTALSRSWIFPKADVYSSECMHNIADIVSVSGGTVGIAQLYTAAYVSNVYTSDIKNRLENNFFKVGGGLALQLNFDATPTTNPANFDNYIRRNTIVGGNIDWEHWITNGSPNRRLFFESNIALNSETGIVVPPSSSSWFDKTGTNVDSTNTALVNSNGHLVDTTNRGKTGHGIWKP